jgi:transposase-like protein
MSEPTERKRRHFSDDQKATVVRRHLADKVPAKRLLGLMELSTSKFHPWKDR